MAEMQRYARGCRVERVMTPLDIAFEEESLLRMGLAALDAVYTELDMASIALSKCVAA